MITLFMGLCGLTLILGLYELATGRMPGPPAKQGTWGYRWLSSPLNLRLTALVGLLVVCAFLIFLKPFSPLDLVAGCLGAALGLAVVISDSRSH